MQNIKQVLVIFNSLVSIFLVRQIWKGPKIYDALREGSKKLRLYRGDLSPMRGGGDGVDPPHAKIDFLQKVDFFRQVVKNTRHVHLL